MSDHLLRCPNASMRRPTCKRRSCPVCGPRWARDWQRVLGVNLEHVGVPVVTLAITAPGAKRLPWACERNHKHAGTKGCKCQERPLREWCDTLGYRWQLLRQAARIATKRELGYAPPWLLCRVWEPQKRGAPHLHLVMPFGSAAEKRAAWAFTKHLKRLALEYDFGDVGRRKGPDLQPIAGKEAARYLANYLAGRTGKKTSIRDNIADPNLPRSLLWLTPKLTRETLVTMRTLRRARHLWAAWDGRCDPPAWHSFTEAVRIAIVFRTIYPARAGPAVYAREALEWAASCEGRALERQLPRLVYLPDAATDWWQPNAERNRELIRLALTATHDRDWRAKAEAAKRAKAEAEAELERELAAA